MTCRRVLFFALTIAALLLGVGWLLWSRTAITRDNAAKIREGMTVAEVEAVLGGPARQETSRKLELEPLPGEQDTHTRRAEWDSRYSFCKADDVQPLYWCSDEVIIVILVDSENRVKRVDATSVRPASEPVIDRLRRLLRLSLPASNRIASQPSTLSADNAN
jgi:hypothetical protein